MRKFVAVFCVLFTAAPALAQVDTMQGSGATLASPRGEESQGSQTGGVDANGERRICRRLADTASRMSSRRVCMTAREWREHSRNQ